MKKIVADHVKRTQKRSETHQWVHNVRTWSSEYSSTNWSHNMIKGPPLVYPAHNDDSNAWAPAQSGQVEFIEIEYDQEVRPTKMDIYETYFPGALTTISCLPIKDGVEDTQWHQLWTSPVEPFDQNCTNSRIHTIEFTKCDVLAKTFRLDMDLSNWSCLFEIDAVCLYGIATPKPNKDGLFLSMKNLLKNPVFTDLTLEVDGKEIQAHKAIVSSRSDVFEMMFTIGMKESTTNRFPIKGIRYEIFVLLLEFMYTAEIEKLDNKDVIELYMAANQYSVKDLQEYMIAKFQEMLNVENVLDVYFDQVIKLKALGLRESCLEFIADNKEIVTQKEFGQLEKEDLMEIFAKMAQFAKE